MDRAAVNPLACALFLIGAFVVAGLLHSAWLRSRWSGRLAIPLDKQQLLDHFADQLVRADELVWDERTESVNARRVIRCGELLVEEKPLADVPRAARAPRVAAIADALQLPRLAAFFDRTAAGSPAR